MKYIDNVSKKRIVFTWLCEHLPNRIRPLLYLKPCAFSIKYRYIVSKTLNRYDNKDIKNIDLWKKSYKKLCMHGKEYLEEAKIFFETDILEEKKSERKPSEDSLILVLIVKNDLVRLKAFLKYYRGLGVSKFIVLDDKSTDGTFNFLYNQNDVDLYTSSMKYSTLGRQAWISRFVDLYGFNRWYLIVDSDEFISYSGMEKIKLNQLISILENDKRNVLRMMLLEMYPKYDILTIDDIDENNIQSVYTYFDKKGYKKKYTNIFTCIVGGVRCRTFYNGNYTDSPYLTKYPLIKMKEGMIPCHSHMNFPFNVNRDIPLSGCILHYKFLPQDIGKYKERIKKRNFQSGSKEYRKYFDVISSNGKLIMYDEDFSMKYEDSSSLNIFEIEKFVK